MATYVKPFRSVGVSDVIEVGGKCANLGELIGAGLPVPPGFAITSAAFKDFIADSGIHAKFSEVTEGVDWNDTNAIDEASQHVRAELYAAAIPSAITGEIIAAYKELCGDEHELPVAVRSSATAEDGAEASFAGVQDTYLWMRGYDEVVEAVRRCWASFFSPEALQYRHQNGLLGEGGGSMSVGVQRMVDAEVAGVMFTLNPMSGDRSSIAIEGSWGLGQSVVSGEVTPDSILYAKIPKQIIKHEIATKTVECIPDPVARGVAMIPVEEPRQGIACLSDAQIHELAAIGRTVEKHYGRPQDIEWALERGTHALYLLQARPETVWSTKPKEKPEGTTVKSDNPAASILGTFLGKS